MNTNRPLDHSNRIAYGTQTPSLTNPSLPNSARVSWGSTGIIMTTERRRQTLPDRLTRGVFAYFLKVDTDTREKDVILYQVCIAIALLIFNLVREPPPYHIGAIILLPASVWSGLLLLGSALQIVGRELGNGKLRKNALRFSLYVSCFMVGPMWLNMPVAAVAFSLVIVLQGFLGGTISFEYKKELGERVRQWKDTNFEELDEFFSETKDVP